MTEGGFDPELLRQATHLEAQGIAAAEGGNLELALEKFNQAIQLLPERASAFNNRAQALRLQGDVASKCAQGFIHPLPPLVTMAVLGLGQESQSLRALKQGICFGLKAQSKTIALNLLGSLHLEYSIFRFLLGLLAKLRAAALEV